jgi:hypothetical protein
VFLGVKEGKLRVVMDWASPELRRPLEVLIYKLIQVAAALLESYLVSLLIFPIIIMSHMMIILLLR